ncbi:MAG: phage tail sheath C-terminal domain-containing protein, partial [Bradyrhizobium sp.]
LAARASGRGAWIAPANEPFKDIVALTPPIEFAAWLPLQDAQVNLIRADARGFLALNADTLSDELERRPINVRRLLILLRRVALRRGASYVFEPNGDALRRSVERGFTVLLTDLFRRGAFSGTTAAESFKVVTDDAVNTAADRDAGRLLVELRVAPALPLQFLTVRLAQTGERLTVVEEL